MKKCNKKKILKLNILEKEIKIIFKLKFEINKKIFFIYLMN